jgi:hypothetical protein
MSQCSVWRFTIEYGQVETFAPSGRIEKLKVVHAEDDDTDIYELPLPDPKLIERIKQVVCAQFGDHIDGKGYYCEHAETFTFAPK